MEDANERLPLQTADGLYFKLSDILAKGKLFFLKINSIRTFFKEMM